MALDVISYIKAKHADGGGSGTTNYAALTNKPKINGVTLSGDNEFEDLGMRPLSKAELKAMWDD